MLITNMSRSLACSLNELGPPTLASLQRVHLTAQLISIVRQHLPVVRLDFTVHDDVAPPLNGLLLFARFARRVHAVSLAAGRAPQHVPVDEDLLPTMSLADCEDWFVTSLTIDRRVQVVVEGLEARTAVAEEGSVWERFSNGVALVYIDRGLAMPGSCESDSETGEGGWIG